ncbi:ABC transporter substrate-binding protein [Thioclava sp. BHET1]|nr:ABC transporter substrate-binding protein [Thioclava sp. BHET1]
MRAASMFSREEIIMKILRMASFALAAAAMLSAGAARAEDTVKVGYMKIPPLVTLIYGMDHGLFKQQGIKIDLSILNSAPELMTALASNSVDIGMTAVGSVLLARAKGLQLQAFGTSDIESPDHYYSWLMTDKASGITTLKQLEGKTVGVEAKHSPATMMVRDQMLAAGLDPNKVNFVALPFPQLPSALAVGNVSAVMVGEPYHTQIKESTKSEGITLARGGIADLAKTGPIAMGGWFATDAWLAKPANREIAKRFLRAVHEANVKLVADRSLVNAILEKHFGMTPEKAASVPLPLNDGNLAATPNEYEPIIEALVRTGMIPSAIPVKDAIVTLDYQSAKKSN